jgi:hypothetical protein
MVTFVQIYAVASVTVSLAVLGLGIANARGKSR